MSRSFRNVHFNGITISFGTNKLVGYRKNVTDSRFILSFNLPTVKTCPGSTEMCRRGCAGRKAEECYISCLPSRNSNLVASQGITFVDDMVYLINKHKGKLGTKKLFLINGTGDFYGQEYFEKWVRIAKRCPDVLFLARTKSFKILDFRYVPENMSLAWSVMPDTDPSTIPTLGPRVYDGDCLNIPENTVSCSGHCNECKVCWNLKTLGLNVRF